MKKILAILVTAILAVTACLGLTACGSIKYVKSTDQLGALTEVKAGTSDIAVIDSVMANYYVSKENFSDLQVLTGEDFTFESEYYAIGFRKNGNTKDYINYALYTIQQNGTLNIIAAKYGLTDSLTTFTEVAYPGEPTAGSDFAYIKAQGKLKLGYTIFEPIAYKDANNNLIGFDIEVAQAVCDVLGITLENVKINWDTKEDELNNKNIDCIWNGFTFTEERAKNVDFSAMYMINRQAIVIRKADATKYTSYAAMKDAKFTAESESAGEETIQDIISKKIFD